MRKATNCWRKNCGPLTAGFLRVMNGTNPLDASAVHPEAYPVVQKIAERTGRPLKAMIGDPAFLRVLRQIAVACGEAGVPVTVCGEMAGRPLDTMALLGLGYRRLSMAPASIGPIKETIRNVDVAGLEDLVSMMIETNAKGIRSRFRAYARDHAGIS